jgi:hypothetical protein
VNTQIAKTFTDGLESLTFGPIFDDAGQIIVPDSATLAVNINGTELAIAGTPTVNTDTSVITYTWQAAEITSLTDTLPKLGVRARWSIVKGATNYERTQFFDTVAVNISTNVVDSDIVRMHPPLENLRHRNTGVATATGGGFDAKHDLFDTKRRHEPSQWYLGANVRFTSGSNRGERRIVTLYDGVDSHLELHEDLPYDISAGDAYEISTSYQPAIDRAWSKLHSILCNMFGADVLSGRLWGGDVRDAHILLSVVEVLRELLITGREGFQTALDNFEGQFSDELQRAQLKIAASIGDGTYDPDTDSVYQPLPMWSL